MQWGHTTIYPNQYIVLVGPSGRARKGEPIEIAKNLITHSNVSLVGEAITRQKLIKRLKESWSVLPSPQLGLAGHSSMTGIFGEFAAFLGEGDQQFLVDLTDWYDSRDTWKYDTKHGGVDDITGVCLNLFGAMAPDWIPLCIPRGAIGGGFTSRILWVVATQKEKIVADPSAFPLDESLESGLAHDLERVSLISGEYKFSQEARDSYVQWYSEEEAKIQLGNLPIADPRFSGYVSRRATHIKKLCMVIAAAKSDLRTISDEDFKDALKHLLDIEKDMEGVFSRVGLSAYTVQTADIESFIRERKKCWKSEILRHFKTDLDMRTFDSIESYFSMTKEVKVIRDTEKSDTIYEWVG